MRVSILIPTYLETERVYNLIETIVHDAFFNKVREILIVTPEKNLTLSKPKKIKIIYEKEREGKSKAIRIGLKNVKSNIIILLSSDLRMRKNFIKFLIRHLNNEKVGMIIGRPLPDKNSNIYEFSKIVWDLHHLLCLKEPKGTEIMAFKKIFSKFPKVSADEVYIEYKIRKAGYRVLYEPKACGYTKIPYNLLQFFRQRKRIHNGHIQIKKEYGFKTSSMKYSLLFSVMLEYLRKNPSIKTFIYILILSYIEIFSRVSALIESFFGKYEIVWKKY